MKIPEINERIRQLIDYYTNGRVNRFAELLPSISQQRLNRLFNIDKRTGKYPVATTDIISDITNIFVNVNTDWLLTGRGEMFSSANGIDSQSAYQYPAVENEGMLISDISAHYGSVLEPEAVTSIPIVDMAAVADGRSHSLSYTNKSSAAITLPSAFLPKGKYNCIQVHDQSMMPTLQDGSYIIIRFLERSEWTLMKDGGIYFFSTRNGGIYIKRIKNRLREHGFIFCMSDNPDKVLYPDFNLTYKDFTSVWSVELYLSPQMPNIGATYDSRLRKLDDDIDEIKATLDRLMRSKERD